MSHKHGKVIATISIVLVIGFLFTSFISFFVSKASLRDEIAHSALPLTGDNIFSEVQRDLQRPIIISSMMAADTFIKDWILDGELDPSLIIRYLKAIQTEHDTFTSFFVSDATSNYYHADGILKQVSPDSWRDVWYYRVREMEEDFEINIDPDMASQDTMTIFINYRVLDDEGNFLGATGVGLRVRAVKNLIEEYERKYHRRIFFIDRDGMVTLHGLEFPAGIENISQIDGLAALADSIINGDGGGDYRYKRDGRTILLNTRFVPEFDWFFLVEQAENEVFRGIFAALMLNIAICFAVIAIVLLVIIPTLRSYHREIETMAATDHLTGAYNRHVFKLLENENAILSDKTIPQSIILADLDRFKIVNDTYGHSAGDVVLKDVVSLMKKLVRASDIIYRWGGEEFLIILQGCTLERAKTLAEDIRKAIESHTTQYKGAEIKCTISLGIAQRHPQETESEVFNRADKAMYLAKHNGRNRVESDN